MYIKSVGHLFDLGVDMKRTKLFISFLLCLSLHFISTGCASHIAFTQELREEYNLTDDELKNLQFYTSDKIVLERELISADREVSSSHILVTKQGKQIDQVIIKKGTPGITISSTPSTLDISFEEGSFLLFSCGLDQKGEYEIYVTNRRMGNGELTFEDQVYLAIDRSTYTYLLISKESLLAVEKSRRVLSGRTLPPDY